MGNIVGNIMAVVIYIAAFILVIFLAKYTSVYLAKKNMNFYKDKKIKILERIPLGKDKDLFIVEVNNKEYFIGSTNGNIVKFDEYKVENEDKV